METDLLSPDAEHAPKVQQDDGNNDYVEHGSGANTSSTLDGPQSIDAHGLGGKTSHEQKGELNGVVGLYLVLQCLDDSDSRVETVAEKEVAYLRQVPVQT